MAAAVSGRSATAPNRARKLSTDVAWEESAKQNSATAPSENPKRSCNWSETHCLVAIAGVLELVKRNVLGCSLFDLWIKEVGRCSASVVKSWLGWGVGVLGKFLGLLIF